MPTHRMRQRRDEWGTRQEKLLSCSLSDDDKPVDRDYFRGILPVLTKRLGRLQGLSTSLTSYFSTDPLPDLILLYERARQISKTFASYQSLSETEMTFELSDISVVLSRICARFEQMPYEVDILQADVYAKICELEADVLETRSRFSAVKYFFGALIFLTADYLVNKVSLTGAMRPIARAVLGWAAAYSVAAVFCILATRYYRRVAGSVPRVRITDQGSARDQG
jgi:hypothetical protein